MFVNYKAVVVFYLLIASGHAESANIAGEGVPRLNGEESCNTFGECRVDVSDRVPEITELCDAPNASVAWNEKRPGFILITCDCQCTAHDNIGWLVTKDQKGAGHTIQRYSLGRESTVRELEGNPGYIPDIMASHPLCEGVDSRKLKKSVFVSLIKQPTNNESEPYCFYPAYFVEGEAGVELVTDNSEDGFGRLLREEDEQGTSKELLGIFVPFLQR
jgi:hypothetical protein